MFKVVRKKTFNELEKELEKAQQKIKNLTNQITSSEKVQLSEFTSLITEGCHTVDLNLNDFFVWGCADMEEVDIYDLEYLMPLIEVHGWYLATSAYCCLIRGILPQYPVLKRLGGEEKLKRVIKEVVDIAKKEDLFLSEKYVYPDLTGGYDINGTRYEA